jgi:T5SS/PEP-CTERM-associated repeat protein
MAGIQTKARQWTGQATIAATCGLLALAAPLHGAVTSNWQNATNLNNDFSTPTTNWDNGHVPVDGDTAVFGLDATYTVTFSADTTTSAFRVTSGNVTFDLGSHKYGQTATNAETPPVVGAIIGDADGDDATLTILNGTLSSDSSATSGRRVIGNASGSTGKLIVSTGGKIAGNGRYITVGNSGEGTLEVINGGQISNVYSYIAAASGSVGHVTIDGAGSKWSTSSSPYIAHGANSRADILISNGGIFYSGSGTIADATGAEAEIDVTGTVSIWQAGVTTLGGAGSATLNISNGGALNSNGTRSFTIASTGIVNLKGSGALDFGTKSPVAFNGGTLNVTGLSNTLKGSTVTFDDAAHFNITLAAGQANASAAHVDVGAAPLTLGANGIDVLLDSGFMPHAGDAFTLLSWTTPATWTLDPSLVHLPDLDGGMSWDISNLVSGGTIIVVPEPATATLVGIALAGWMFTRRRGS